MNDLLKTVIGTLAMISIFIGFVLVVALGGTYLWQWHVKNTWGDFKYDVIQDNETYFTNDYEIDYNSECISFTDNYGKDREWCEKFRVGEFYFHKSNPSWKTIVFGW